MVGGLLLFLNVMPEPIRLDPPPTHVAPSPPGRFLRTPREGGGGAIKNGTSGCTRFLRRESSTCGVGHWTPTHQVGGEGGKGEG